MPLMPKRTKYRKQQKGRNRGKATRGNVVTDGLYGLQALEAVEYWVAVVKPGRILFELADVSEDIAREALRLAANKLSVKCKFVKKETEVGGELDEDK